MSDSRNILIGGAAGLGVKTAGLAYARLCSRAGLRVFASVEYPSVIRGDHNSVHLTVGADPVLANGSRLDVLVALDRLALDLHAASVKPGGAVVYDGEAFEAPAGAAAGGGAVPVDVPLEALARDSGGGPIAVNAMGLGALQGALGAAFEPLEASVRGSLRKLGKDALDRTVRGVRNAFELARERAAGRVAPLPAPPSGAPRRMLVSGNEALAIGAVKAGCTVYASYPMTPSSSILTYLARIGRRFGLAVKHAEDELAAAGVAVGAAWAGARAMTGTSGGGFCLMTEFLGLAGMTETPVVFVESQRPGPSTGLPTRTEQGDLLFVLSASQGEFPRIVLAPGDPEECFRWGFEAFNLAERFQTPVILLLDKHVSESYWTCERFSEEGMAVDRGAWADPASLKGPDFPRHALTPSGISPRWRPGTPGAVTVTTGDEHDEFGHITEDPGERSRQTAKRLRKLDGLDVSRDGFALHGDPRAPLTLVGWGSTKGVVLEAMGALAARGIAANFLQVRFLHPFPSEGVARILGSARRAVLVENNATGQLGDLIAQKALVRIPLRVLRCNGRMFMADELAAEIEAALS